MKFILIPLIGPRETRGIHPESTLADRVLEYGVPRVLMDRRRFFVHLPEDDDTKTQIYLYEEVYGEVLKLEQ